MNRVTIGIPCYKQAEYLGEAIQSALDQTVKCDIVVVNDGSPDDTKEVAQEYPVKIINQVNKGLASARNSAIMAMEPESDYFFPLDADDIMLPHCIEMLLEEADKQNADIVAPSFKTFGLAEEEVILMQKPRWQDFLTGNRLGYFSLIRKEALVQVGGYSPRMTWGWEDLHLWFNLLTRGKRVVTLPHILMLYRTKEGSMWHESVKHDKELWEQIFKDFPYLLNKEIVTV